MVHGGPSYSELHADKSGRGLARWLTLRFQSPTLQSSQTVLPKHFLLPDSRQNGARQCECLLGFSAPPLKAAGARPSCRWCAASWSG